MIVINIVFIDSKQFFLGIFSFQEEKVKSLFEYFIKFYNLILKNVHFADLKKNK